LATQGETRWQRLVAAASTTTAADGRHDERHRRDNREQTWLEMNLVTMELTMKRRVQARSKRPLSPEKLRRREAIFALYRDMGPGRTYERVIEMARLKYGAVSRRTLVNWSQQHNWHARLAEYDQRLVAAAQPSPVELGPDFDMVDALNRIAQSALHRVLMNGNGKPRDLKALVETAEKALMLAEKLRQMGMARRSPEEVQKAQQEMRDHMAYIKKKTMERHAAEGHPVASLKDQHPEIDDEPADMAGGSTVH
jgi:hypothetical protein